MLITASKLRLDAPQPLRHILLKHTIYGGEPPHDIPLFLFEALHLAARTTHFPVPCFFGGGLIDHRSGTAERVSPDRDLLVRRQYFSRAVAGFPGRVLQALARHVPTAGSHLVALLEQPWRLIERGGLRRWFGGFRGPVLC